MWGIVKKAINSTVGKGMKTLDVISKEDSADVVYNFADIISVSSDSLSDIIGIAPIEPILPTYAFYSTNFKRIFLSSKTKAIGIRSIIENSNLEKIDLSNIVRIDDQGVTNNPNLETIFLGKSLKKIGEHGIAGNSSLNNIFYNGTIAEWNEIEKGFYWDSGCGEYKIRCIDGKI